jgi:hypothetical protein
VLGVSDIGKRERYKPDGAIINARLDVVVSHRRRGIDVLESLDVDRHSARVGRGEGEER